MDHKQHRQFREWEEKCTQGSPPACTTTCPMHVDVMGFLAEMKAGRFNEAVKILRKTLPFPGITARICDHPCQTACKRGEVGDPVSIAALERACVELNTVPPVQISAKAKKDKRVAITGGGLSGLTAAYDLAVKGYGVVLFESRDRLGGKIWDTPEAILPRAVIAEETAVLERLGVEIRFNTAVGEAVTLDALCADFDAVYLGTGEHGGKAFNLETTPEGRLSIDPVTFSTSREGVFAGGGLRGGPKYSMINSQGDGRRAAISIDRFVQKVSLFASRENEGPYPTKLFTSTKGIEPLPAFVPANPDLGYTGEEAILEAGRCLQCECLECVKACEYLAHYKRYPGKYLRDINHNLKMVMGVHTANKMINSCSLCGLCGVICPNDLNMGEVCKNARETMVKKGKMPPSPHDFPLRDMQFSNSEMFALARPEPGWDSSKYLFFPGCQLSASAPEYTGQAYSYLREKLTGGVGLMLRCCGAPADWVGRTELFQENLQEIAGLWDEMGKPTIILACSSCYEIFKGHLPEIEAVSLWEVMDRVGLPPVSASNTDLGKLAVHDACSTRQEKHVHDSVRRILVKLGYEVEELEYSREKTECCGFGGLMSFANPELANKVIDRRIGESERDYVAYCAICRDKFANRGKRTFHLLDLIYGGGKSHLAERKDPGYSQRHENRARLKNKLLREIWGEKVEEAKGFAVIKLDIAEDLKALLEERLILVEDIQKVIDYAENTGNKLYNQDTGHFMAYHRPVSVTYWVEYSPRGEGFAIHNAYSHRMQIVEEVKQ
ncbi:MAG: NAD-dependent dihydropyrimidine dehydrogenase subunit PreT [Firmicutes bacterium ADurb.Bin456]|nr:MAG: NAD-dependent dihydropyrimidine dehydrogenase subunit PreT [Firmicutes bacterium ADurb.Bin456]